jgi:hypothetical protein
MIPERRTPVAHTITDTIKPFAIVAGALISLGMGWGELTTRIDQKAEAVALEALSRRLDQAESRNVAEARINRILLCRLAEIRPDSYCEGFR